MVVMVMVRKKKTWKEDKLKRRKVPALPSLQGLIRLNIKMDERKTL